MGLFSSRLNQIEMQSAVLVNIHFLHSASTHLLESHHQLQCE